MCARSQFGSGLHVTRWRRPTMQLPLQSNVATARHKLAGFAWKCRIRRHTVGKSRCNQHQPWMSIFDSLSACTRKPSIKQLSQTHRFICAPLSPKLKGFSHPKFWGIMAVKPLPKTQPKSAKSAVSRHACDSMLVNSQASRASKSSSHPAGLALQTAMPCLNIKEHLIVGLSVTSQR